jgi:Tfp pilus assembly protein PilV
LRAAAQSVFARLVQVASLLKRLQKADRNTVLASKRAGTTLIEIMVAVSFLGIGAVALLKSVNSSLVNEGYARRRALILAAAQDAMDSVRSSASMGSVSNGSTVVHLTVPGLQSTVTITTTTTLQSTYSDLYLVDVSATWHEQPGIGVTRGDSIVLDTFVRTNDT